MIKPIVYYHFPCWDGFTAGWVAHRKFPDAVLCPAEYGKTPPPGRNSYYGRDVVLLDFTWDRPILEDMERHASSLTVLDHHASAEVKLRGIKGCIFDMNRSGAMMAWDHFFPENSVPDLIRYVQDRDLWKFELPKSREINAAIGSYQMTWDTWNRLAFMDLDLLAKDGVAILRSERQMVDLALRSKRIGQFRGYRTAMVNSSVLKSEIGEALCRDSDIQVALIWSQTESGAYSYSLRADKEGVAVNNIAAEFGGGGHPKAAGFISPTMIELE